MSDIVRDALAEKYNAIHEAKYGKDNPVIPGLNIQEAIDGAMEVFEEVFGGNV